MRLTVKQNGHVDYNPENVTGEIFIAHLLKVIGYGGMLSINHADGKSHSFHFKQTSRPEHDPEALKEATSFLDER